MNRYFFFLLLCFCPFWNISAQSGQTFLGSTGKDLIAHIAPAPDGGYYATGAKQVGSHLSVWLLKLDSNGNMLWEKSYSPTSSNADGYGHRLVWMPDGGILIVGEQRSNDPINPGTALAIKTDAAGNLHWKRIYTGVHALYDAAISGSNVLLVGWVDYSGSSDGGLIMQINAAGELQWKVPVDVLNQTKTRRIFPTSDGKFLVAGRTNVIGNGFGGVFLRKIEPNGALIWEKTLDTHSTEANLISSTNFFDQTLAATQWTDGSVWISNAWSNKGDIVLAHFSPEGVLIEQKTYKGSKNETPYAILDAPDGGFVIAGTAYESTSPANFQGFALRLSAGFVEQWRYLYGSNTSTEQSFGLAWLNNDMLMLCGMSNNVTRGKGNYDGWLLRVEPSGNALPWQVRVRVVADSNNNCQADPGELPLPGWFLSVSDAETDKLVITDEQGRSVLRTDDGTITVTAFSPEITDVGWTLCQEHYSVTTNIDNQTVNVIFLAQVSDSGCPHTEVGITQPDLMRCSTSTYIITVQNRGIGESDYQLLSLVLDPELSLVAATEPYSLVDHTVDFLLPPMAGLQQKSIKLNVRLSCNVQLGATHAMVARLSPVECAPIWNGPYFTVKGQCQGSFAQFLLQNPGNGDSSTTTRFRVLADDLLHADWTDITLAAGDIAQELVFPADGRTWRVELEQASGYTIAGRPAVALEGCGVEGNGLHSIALRNAWHSDDGMPGVAAVQTPNTTGVPNKVVEALSGFGYYNFVEDTNWLEFTARVRNPLSGAADKVTFQFELSANLNIRSFQVVASNGPVQLEIDNLGILRATIQALGLAPGEYAMLRFRIRPMPGVVPNAGTSSLFRVDAQASFNDLDPYPLATGFHNYAKTFPVAVDSYNSYTPEILRFGGKNFDFGISLALAPDNSVFLVGETNSYSDRTNFDGLLIKTDSTGRAFWLTAFDFGDQGWNTFRGVAPLSDGGCIVAGSYKSPEAASNSITEYHVYAVRFDAGGGVVWSKKFRPAGGLYGAWSNGIVESADGHFIIFGYAGMSDNSADAYYLKINVLGEMLWERYEPVVGSTFRPSKALRVADGGVVFLGQNDGSIVKYDVFLEKLDSDGNQLWSKGYSTFQRIYLGGFAPTPAGGFFVNGYAQWEIGPGEYGITPVFMRFSSLGNVELEKYPKVGPFNIARLEDVIPAPDGGFLSVGEVLADTSNQRTDALLLKTDDLGNILWWKHYGSKNSEQANSAVISGADQLLLWGHNQSRAPYYDLQSILIHTDWREPLSVQNRPAPAIPMSQVSVAPNPTRHRCRVTLSPAPLTPVRWQLHDRIGRILKSGILSEAAFDMELHDLPAGLYFLVFPGQAIPTKRIAVMR